MCVCVRVCVCVCSSLVEQKEDLRKRLSYTTHKLELLQSEFDSTRQYLETELRRAQEELDKFTDKLRRLAPNTLLNTLPMKMNQEHKWSGRLKAKAQQPPYGTPIWIQ